MPPLSPWMDDPKVVKRITLTTSPAFFYEVHYNDPTPKYTAIASKPDPEGTSMTIAYHIGPPFDTVDEAMAACQTDYDTYGSGVPPGTT
jgi:hypothetical protein